MSTDKEFHEQKQVLASLARLQNNPDFGRFMKQYIGSLLEEYVQHCIAADNSARAQGAAQALQRIQKDVEEAEDAFYRLTNQAEIPLD